MNINAMETYLTDKLGPLPFCPGCGHDPLIKALDAALVKLQRPANKVVVVTDIGCIGLADRYFVTHGFHGLHGRSLTYACGLKLARPELTVVVLMGDGGCGIGGAHLLNVARRNIGVTLVVANNFNYGMTGGQHSVTTPMDGHTATTPGGNQEVAMDLCGVVGAAGAPWAYRGTIYDKDLPGRIAEAIEQPGFAVLDIWNLCTAYYVPRNKFNKKSLFDLIDRSGLETGLIVDKPRPELGESLRMTPTPKKATPSLETRYGNEVTRQTGIVIAGSAGEKVRSAATLFAQAAMMAGLNATQKDDYPITVMTGHSVTEVIVSPETIDYTGIDEPDILVVLSVDGLKKSRGQIARLPETCILFAEEGLELPETPARVVRLPLVQTARKISRLTMTTVALGAVLEEIGLFPAEALADAIERFQKPDIAKQNLKALAAGAALMGDQTEA